MAKCWQGCGLREPCSLLEGMRDWLAIVKEAVWHFLTKLNILSAYKSATVLFCIYTNELKTYVHTETYTGIFTDSLFIIAQTWKQQECPSVGKWKSTLGYVQTAEYCSVLHNNSASKNL